MGERSVRRWFRFRLATLMVMSLAASALLAVNVLLPQEENYYLGWIEWGTHRNHGWPFPCYFSTQVIVGENTYPDYWNWKHAAYDVLIGLGISGLVGACFEWVLRWREARKG